MTTPAEVPQVSWEDVLEEDDLIQIQAAAIKIKDAAATIAFNESIIHSFAVRLAMKCAKAALTKVPEPKNDASLVKRIHAICHAFGQFQSGSNNAALGNLADRIIEAERETRQFTRGNGNTPTGKGDNKT